jgi:hypothetical protein
LHKSNDSVIKKMENVQIHVDDISEQKRNRTRLKLLKCLPVLWCRSGHVSNLSALPLCFMANSLSVHFWSNCLTFDFCGLRVVMCTRFGSKIVVYGALWPFAVSNDCG